MALTTRADTRDRLVDVAGRLLEEEGLEAITLRAIARRAGVSHGAPFRHFPSLAALLSHVAAGGFRILQDAVARAANEQSPGAGARARLAAAGRAYVEAAVAHPELFALMFRPERLDGDVPELAAEGLAAFEQLVILVRGAQDAGWRPGDDTRVLAGSLWAGAHGLATLWAQGAIQPATGNDSLEKAVTSMLDLTRE